MNKIANTLFLTLALGVSQGQAMEAQIEDKTHPWAELPVEVQCEILQYLTPRELVTASQVNSVIHDLSQVNTLWKKHFLRDFPEESVTIPIEQSWKNYYRELSELHRSTKEMIIKSITSQSRERNIEIEEIFSTHDVSFEFLQSLTPSNSNRYPINLRESDLKKIPEGIFKKLLINVQSCQLHYNRLTTLPNDIKNLRNVGILNLEFNPFEVFPDGFYDLLKNTSSPVGLDVYVTPDQLDKIQNDGRYNNDVLRGQGTGGKIKFIKVEGSSYPLTN